jgi:hypothetical protein
VEKLCNKELNGSVLLTHYCAGDKIKNEMGGAYSMYEEERGVYRVLVGNLRKRYHCGDPGTDGRIILRWIFRKWVVWIRLS